MTENRAVITNFNDEPIGDREYTLGLEQATQKLTAFEQNTELFAIVERYSSPYGPYLFNLDALLEELGRLKTQIDEQKYTISQILNNPDYECGGLSKDEPIVCKLYKCVYNSIANVGERDILNATLDIETRKKLITILARSSLTSGWSPLGGCAFPSDGEGTILSLIRTTPESDVMPILAHLQANLNGKPLLETLIAKMDLGALLSAITYIEKSSEAAISTYANLNENDPDLVNKVNERIIPVYDNDLYANDFEGKIKYNATYENGVVKVERQVYGCKLVERSDGAGNWVWVPDCAFSSEASYSLNPYEMVTLNNMSKLSAIENDLDIGTGGIGELPALALVYISQEQSSNKTWQAINLASTVVGTGGSLIAYRAGKFGIAALEAAAVLGSMGQDGINMGLIPTEYQSGIANYNLIVGGLGLTAGATSLPKMGALALRQVRSGFTTAISRVSAQQFLDAYEALKANAPQWATLGSTAQGRAVQQKMTNLAKYLKAKGMIAGQTVRSGIMVASAVKRWGKYITVSLALITNMFVVDPVKLSITGDLVSAITPNKTNVAFKSNGITLENIVRHADAPIPVKGANSLDTSPSTFENIDFDKADEVLPDGTIKNAIPQGPRQVTIQQASVGDYLLLQLGIAGLGTVYLAQKNQNNDDCSICKGIIVNGQNRKEICKSLEALASKAGLAYKSIIENRLCKSTLSNLRLAEVVTQLTAYSQAEVKAFLDDINNISVCSNGGCLANNINNLTFDLVQAWKIIYDARCTTCDIKREMDWALLTKVRTLQGDAVFLNDIKTTETTGKEALSNIISKNKRAACFICTPPPADARHLRKLTEYLDDVQNLVVNYGGLTGTTTVVGAQGIKNAGFKQVEATAFILKTLNSYDFIAAIGSRGSINGFEVEYQDDSECSADITLVGNKLIECKSWNLFNPKTWGNMPSNQFLTYLGAIPSMDNLQYWFEGIKITGNTEADKLIALKTKFQEVFRKTNSTGDNIVFEKIWGNTALRESLFPRGEYPQEYNDDQYEDAAKPSFQRLINSLDNKLYGFIKVK